ncbi:MAG: efflux RND transporter periplasmic adaptor subunit [Pseudomonadota bacterium]
MISHPLQLRTAIGALIVGSCLTACSEAPAPAPPPVRPVKFFQVYEGGGERDQEYPGEVRAADTASVGFEVSGRVVSLLAQEGQKVAAGDVLATLDDRDYRANLDIAQADLRKAQADLQRSESVYAEDPGAITVERIDSDRRALEVAQAQVAQARKAVEDCTVRAPFDGVVSRRLIEQFENVQAKQPVVIVENLARIEVEVAVPERDVLERGRPGNGLSAADLELLTAEISPRITFNALPGIELPGRITEVAARADATTRTFAARIAFDAPQDITLLPGMTARVKGRFEGAAAIVDIPLSALASTTQAQGRVWVIDTQSMTVTGREVLLGSLHEDRVTVLAGLSGGEVIAATGAAQLAEGMKVRRFE